MSKLPIIHNIDSVIKLRTERVKLWTHNDRVFELQQATIYLLTMGSEPPLFIEYCSRLSPISKQLRRWMNVVNQKDLNPFNRALEDFERLIKCINNTNSFWDGEASELVSKFIDFSLATHESRYALCSQIVPLYFKLFGGQVNHRLDFPPFEKIFGQINTKIIYDNLKLWVKLLNSQDTLTEYPEVQLELNKTEELMANIIYETLPVGEPIKDSYSVWTGREDPREVFKLPWDWNRN